ncbi:argininosuccinate lyase [soil metagenome]
MFVKGGRFAGASSALFKQLNDSLPVDRTLLADDLAGSAAWARALGRAKVLTSREVARLERALAAIARQDADARRKGKMAPIDGAVDEDVHSFVERELIARVGALGKKLHTGRSRNDQVATDIRLWCVRTIAVLRLHLLETLGALQDLAARELAAGSTLPGFTHLQRGQPVLVAHWALAYFEMLRRDDERLKQAAARAAVSPLGSGALAGTAYPIDRAALARDLGFAAPSRNSLDAVSDRDFGFDFLSAAALCGVHLSRLGEDLVIYSSSEFGFVQMSDGVTSGSSLMPQKKNPDAAELLRGKSGRLLGNLVRLATTLKGLPLAYNKDLQEDKEPLFDSAAQLGLVLRAARECLAGITINRERCRAAADDGFSAATDLADYLVRAGVPFRDAHHTAGALTRRALELAKPLHALTLSEYRAIEPRINADIFRHLRLEVVLAKRDVFGGTAPRRVAEQLGLAGREIASLRKEFLARQARVTASRRAKGRKK